MVYDKQVWRDGPGGTTPLSAARLAVMEQGISDAHDLAAPAAVLEIAQDAMNEALKKDGWTYDDATGVFTPPTRNPGGVDINAVESYLADTGSAWEVYAANGGTGAYPARPATARPVVFYGANPPGSDGAYAGGGGMVPGSRDRWVETISQ